VSDDDGYEIIRPGFEYPVWETVVTEAYQRDKHACCDVETALFGNRVDISFLGTEAIMAARHAGLSINGNVHMTSRFRQSGPLMLGEPIAVRGRVTAVDPAPRGRIIRGHFEFVRRDGSVPLTVDRASLRIDPNLTPPERPAKARGAEVDPRAGVTPLSQKRLEPEKVARYSDEAENLIHSDPEVARQFGFRAPIAAGLMAGNIMMEALARRAGGVPDALDMEIRFLRPMFWDDVLDLYAVTDPAVPGGVGELRLVNGENKVTNTAILRAPSGAG